MIVKRAIEYRNNAEDKIAKLITQLEEQLGNEYRIGEIKMVKSRWMGPDPMGIGLGEYWERVCEGWVVNIEIKI